MKDFLRIRKKLIADHKAQTGQDISDRMTGRTLGIAFEAIGAALQNPCTEISYCDHSGVQRGHESLTDQIQDILVALDLEGFRLNRHRFSLYYDPRS